MGCGWIALKELGIKVDVGYSSEVNKFAIGQVRRNFPDVIHLGSITDVDVSKLAPIDFVMGGSSCQNFSFAGLRQGMVTIDKEEIYTLERYLELKEQNYRFEGESYLFWEYMRMLRDVQKYNPNVLFFLENVEMSKKWENIISEALGLEGVHINSALVSAQNRRRIYWTNIKTRQEGFFGRLYTDIPQPEDRGILLSDILEPDVDEKYFIGEKQIAYITNRLKNSYTQINGNKDLPLTRKSAGNWTGNYITVAQRGRSAILMPKRTEYGRLIRKDYELGKITEKRKNIQQLEPRFDGKTNCLTTVQKDNLLTNGERIRRLTPTEYARLQTVPDWYVWEWTDERGITRKTSDTQICIMCGNGWNIETIKHIYSFIKT